MRAPVISVDDAASLPLFLQIARSIAADVRRGRLKPGAALPGSRTLAQSLGVHRNTVLAAFAELEQEGWIVARRARGTFVADALPEVLPRRFGRAPRSARRVELKLAEPWPVEPYPPAPPGVLPLVGGLPDLRLVQKATLARAYRAALRFAPETLTYGSDQGHPRLRAALAALLATTRGVSTDPEQLIITRGSQMAIHLATRAVAGAGSVIAVEGLGYRPAWEGMRLAGAELVPVPVDGGGIRVDALRALCRRRRIAAVYVTPHHQYPTTVTLAPGRRLELLSLAAEQAMVILEDDYDHEFHYAGRPILPLASADEAGVVVYIGTLSKVFVPGLRIGYAAARPEIIDRMRRVRSHIDRQGDQTLEWAVATLIEDGELGRHTWRVRRHYIERREALLEALRAELGGVLAFEAPPGGMALWARIERRRGRAPDAEAWARRALEAGVLVQPSRRFRFDGRASPHLRLGFGALTPPEIRRAVGLLRAAAPG